MNHVQNPSSSDYFKLTFLAAIWGGSFICIEYALQEYSFLMISFFRIFFAALFLLPFIYIKQLKLPKDMRSWVILMLAGVLNNAIPFSLLAWGQQYINSSTAAIILATGPFIALILSHFGTHDEKISIFKLLGVFLGFAGVFVLLGDDLFHNRHDAFYGELAVFFASFGYIASGLLLRRLSHVSGLVISTSMFVTASLVLAPFVLYLGLPSLEITSTSFHALVILAIIPTAYASLIRIKLIQKTGVQFMSQVTYLIPLFAITWSWIFFDEVPKSIAWLSLLLILIGLFLRKIQLKKP